MNFGWKSHGSFRLIQQVESRLLRRSIGLLPITFYAGGNDVLPVLTPTTSDRDYVVVGKSVGRQLSPAVLAAVLITHKQIVTGKLDLCMIPSDLDVMKKSKHGRQADGNGDAPDLSIVDLDDLHLFLEEHLNGSLPGQYLKRFVGCVQ